MISKDDINISEKRNIDGNIEITTWFQMMLNQEIESSEEMRSINFDGLLAVRKEEAKKAILKSIYGDLPMMLRGVEVMMKTLSTGRNEFEPHLEAMDKVIKIMEGE